MPDRVTYSAVVDLLIGDQEVKTDIKTRHVIDASNEIDSKLGFLYDVPFTEAAVSAPAWILIKRVANNFASGRLLLEVNQSREGASIGYQGLPVKVVSYGQSLIDDAQTVIQMIIDGKINLNPPDPGESDNPLNQQHGMRVVNLDPHSPVEAFYGWAAQRTYPPDPRFPFYPEGIVR